jgi:hypothetical protein
MNQQAVFHSSSPKIGFFLGGGGMSILKPNPERVVEIPEQIFLVRNFTVVLMGEPDLYLLPFGTYSGNKNGENRETNNSPHPPYITSFFSVNRPN